MTKDKQIALMREALEWIAEGGCTDVECWDKAKDCISSLPAPQTESEDQKAMVTGETSDGHHTFNELYEHRVRLYLALCYQLGNKVFYKKDYDEWFCIYLETERGQISYHVPNKWLPFAEACFTHSPDHKFDGHTGADVLERLLPLAALTEKVQTNSEVNKKEKG